MVVTVPEVKAHLRIQHDDEDEYLASLITQAQSAAEDYCRISLPDDTPPSAQLALLLMISHYYENRDNSDKQIYLAMRMTFENLLYPHRDVTKFF